MRILIALTLLIGFAMSACVDSESVQSPTASARRLPSLAPRTGGVTPTGTASAGVTTIPTVPTPVSVGDGAADPPGVGQTETAAMTPAPSPPPPPAGESSGINGIALAGPQCPVERPDSPCPDRPVANAEIDIYSPDHAHKITAVITDNDGRFRVDLAPGDYYLEPQPPDPSRPFPIPRAETVTVRANEYTDVTVSYDTGIR